MPGAAHAQRRAAASGRGTDGLARPRMTARPLDGDLGPAAHPAAADGLHEHPLEGGGGRRSGGEVRQLQVAAPGQRRRELGDHAVRVLVVVEVVDDRVEHEPDRAVEVEEPGDRRAGQDRVRVPDVGRDDRRGGVTRELGAPVGEHDRVVVHVRHAGRRVELLGDLMGVARRGQAGAEVEKLVDALGGEVPDRALEHLSIERGAAGGLGKCRITSAATARSQGKLSLPPRIAS